MVATLLRLRFTTTAHQLRREWWRVLVLVGGIVWSLSLFPSAWWISRVLASQEAGVRLDGVSAIVAIAMAGWVVVPVLISGLDDTLDPGRFASLGVSAKRLMPGLVVSAFVSVPVIFFAVVLGMLASTWADAGGAVVAVAAVGAALTVATMVVSSRVAVAWVNRLLQSRRSREVAVGGFALVAVLVTPVAYSIVVGGFSNFLEFQVPPALAALRATPVALPAAAAGDAASGLWWVAAAKLAAAAAWVVLLGLVWRANVDYTLVHPTFRGGGARPRADQILASVRRADAGRVVRLSRSAASVRARAWRYWFGDPRYLAALISVLVFPALFFTLVYPLLGSPVVVVAAVPVLLAGTIGWGRHNDVAFDSTAMWIDIVSGRPGRDIMRGRLLATLAWAAPLVGVAVVVAALLSSRWDLVPAMLGGAAGVLGTSLGVSAVTSVALPYRAPAPGESPFSAEVGSVGAGLAAQLISSLVAWVVALPVSAPLAAAVYVDSRWGWAGLGLGVATGVAVLVFASRWAGSLYDRRSGRLLGAIT